MQTHIDFASCRDLAKPAIAIMSYCSKTFWCQSYHPWYQLELSTFDSGTIERMQKALLSGENHLATWNDLSMSNTTLRNNYQIHLLVTSAAVQSVPVLFLD